MLLCKQNPKFEPLPPVLRFIWSPLPLNFRLQTFPNFHFLLNHMKSMFYSMLAIDKTRSHPPYTWSSLSLLLAFYTIPILPFLKIAERSCVYGDCNVCSMCKQVLDSTTVSMCVFPQVPGTARPGSRAGATALGGTYIIIYFRHF